MTSVTHHAPRPTATSGAPPVGVNATVVGHHAIAALILTMLLLLVAGAVLLVAALSVDTGGQLPHPIPLPAPSAPSRAGG